MLSGGAHLAHAGAPGCVGDLFAARALVGRRDLVQVRTQGGVQLADLGGHALPALQVRQVIGIVDGAVQHGGDVGLLEVQVLQRRGRGLAQGVLMLHRPGVGRERGAGQQEGGDQDGKGGATHAAEIARLGRAAQALFAGAGGL